MVRAGRDSRPDAGAPRGRLITESSFTERCWKRTAEGGAGRRPRRRDPRSSAERPDQASRGARERRSSEGRAPPGRPLWETRDPDQIFSQGFFQHQFVGLGPYTIDQWNIDDTIVLRPFPGYFMGAPKIGTIVIHRAESTLGLVTLLLSGTIQMNDAATSASRTASLSRSSGRPVGLGRCTTHRRVPSDCCSRPTTRSSRTSACGGPCCTPSIGIS